MKILVANLGSTSFKYRLYDMPAGAQLARGHVLDHALAKRADNIDAHGKLLSRMRLTNTSILSTGLLARHR